MGIPLSIPRWVLAGFTLAAFKVIVDKTLSLRNAFVRTRGYPGRTVSWINPFGAVALMLGTRFPRSGMTGYQAGKFSLYKKFGATSFASVLISTAQQYLWTADPEAIKLITSDRQTFQKDVFVQEVIDFYGRSLISSEGTEWKRHRLVAMSAFNEANVALVWSEVLRVTSEWFQQLDAQAAGSDATIDMLPAMKEATLLVISAAGFGRQMSWNADSTDELPPGTKLTFRVALLGSVHNILFRILIPGWFYRFSSFVRVPYLSSRALFTRLAFDDLRSHMLDLVTSARADILSRKHSGAQGAPLLRNIVEANLKQEGDSKRLTEGEVLSNIFLFLLAGHETSSHTLCFALALLALYPDTQQKMYEEITRIWPEEVPISQLMGDHKRYMDKLEYVAAFVRETLRLFPAANRLFKQVHADAVLPSTRFSPGTKGCSSVEKFSVAVPAGSTVVMDIWALHMNPLCWGEDVEEFKPERFLDTESYQWPRDAFLPFSGGARSCIGQRFAFAQMIGIVASVVRRYHIQVPDNLVKKSFEKQKEVLLGWKTSITLIPLKAHVKLCRRDELSFKPSTDVPPLMCNLVGHGA